MLFSVAAATPRQCPHKVDGFRAPHRSVLMWPDQRSAAGVAELGMAILIWKGNTGNYVVFKSNIISSNNLNNKVAS